MHIPSGIFCLCKVVKILTVVFFSVFKKLLSFEHYAVRRLGAVLGFLSFSNQYQFLRGSFLTSCEIIVPSI